MARTAWWVVLVLATAGWGERAKPEFRLDPGTHTSTAYTICLFGNGRFVATSTDGAVKMWDTATASVLRTIRLRRHCFGLAVSADGQWLAARTDRRSVAVYDTATWRLSRVIRVPWQG